MMLVNCSASGHMDRETYLGSFYKVIKKKVLNDVHRMIMFDGRKQLYYVKVLSDEDGPERARKLLRIRHISRLDENGIWAA